MFWTYVLGVIAFIFVLGLIVLIHEGGHFLLARKAGILCHEFAIGMGPVLFQKKIGETVYSIRLIPIGGYVSMAGEEVEFNVLEGVKKVKLEFNEINQVNKIIVDIDNPKYDGKTTYTLISYDLIGTAEAKEDEFYLEVTNEDTNEVERFTVVRDAMAYFPKKRNFQIAPYDRNFTNKKLGQRFLSVFAGPAMNFVLALVIFFCLGVFQGYPNENSTKVSAPEKESSVYEYIQKDDEILSINGIEVSGKWANIGVATSKVLADPSYQGFLTIEYRDSETNNVETIKVVPNTYINSVELVFKNPGYSDSNNEYFKPVVGKYYQSNTKTKSYKAGLREGDLITGIKLESENEYTEITTIGELLGYFNSEEMKSSKNVIIRYDRVNESGEVEQNLETKKIETYSEKLLDASGVKAVRIEIGISPVYSFNFVKLLYRPWVDTANCVYSIFRTLGLLFTKGANVHIDDFSGPVGIFSLITSSLTNGSFFYMIAYLSVNIGFINLLPLPALDGGRLAFLAYEAITKKRPNAKVENWIHSIGFILLMALFVFISFNDILRLFGVK